MNHRTTVCALGTVLAACSPTNRPTEDGGGSGITSSSGSVTDAGGTDSGGAGTGTGTGGGSNSDGSGGGGDTSGGTPKFDVASPDGGDSDGNGACECVIGEFSYVWVANTDETTVSKINTRTVAEEGRYKTGPGPDRQEIPSRTSVSVDGKAVVVANRTGGIAKFWANWADCQDTNGTPGIQTSSGPGNVLPFGEDDCMAWYVDYSDGGNQRPVQWTPGTWDQSTCTYVDQKVWTLVGRGVGPNLGFCGTEGVSVYRLNGDTGVVEDTIDIPEVEFPCENTRGPYGASVDREGNLWFQKNEQRKYLARVDNVSLDYEIFTFPQFDYDQNSWAYGIVVDHHDRVWLAGGVRFDYAANQFDYFTAPRYQHSGLGLDVARNRIWWGDTLEYHWIDMDTLVQGPPKPWPDGRSMGSRGMSVNVDGFLWAARVNDQVVFKIDPDSDMTWTVTGLNRTYTYSDMTGGQLASVGGCVPPPD